MSISTLAKINIFFHNEDKEQLIHKLQELACIHIVNFKETTTAQTHTDLILEKELTDPELEKKLTELGFAIGCLSPFEQKKGMLAMLAGKKVLLSKSEYSDVLKSFSESEIVTEVKKLEDEEHVLLSEIANNETVIRELSPWKWLDLNVESIKDTDATCVRLGKLPMNKLENLKNSLEKITNLYELYEDNAGTESSAYILLVYAKEFMDAIEDALTVDGFERKDFQSQTGKISDIIDSYKKKDEKDDARLEEIGTKFAEYTKLLPKLKVKYDHLFNIYNRKRIQGSFGGTDNVSVIEGFVDVDDLPKLKDAVEKDFKFAQIEKVDVVPTDKVPTKLKNSNKAVSGFEVILDLYGLPNASFFDPTAYLMPFFTIFFGFCLTDAGYGLVLALFALFLVKKYKPIYGNTKLMYALIVSGFVTVGIGAITGGWFGDFFALNSTKDAPLYLPKFLSGIAHIADKMVLFDPMSEKGVMIFFGVSLAIGFTHLIYGNLLSFFKSVADGKLVDGLCNKMTWVSFLISGVLLLLISNGMVNKEALPVVKYWFLASCAAIVLFTDRAASWLSPIRYTKGLYALYGFSAYIGDTLSYLRLLALGLSSTVIAIVINQLCGLIINAIPVVGIVLAIVIFVGGHLFNLAISALGSFVHSLRLNYVEFFSKFYEGGGKNFIPFEPKLNYMIFNEENKK